MGFDWRLRSSKILEISGRFLEYIDVYWIDEPENIIEVLWIFVFFILDPSLGLIRVGSKIWESSPIPVGPLSELGILGLFTERSWMLRPRWLNVIHQTY